MPPARGTGRNLRFSGARQEGLTEDVVDLIRDGHQAGPLPAREKAVLAFTDSFLFAPAAVTEETRRALREHLSPEQIVELAAGIALFTGFSKIAIALGGVPEDMPVVEVPTPEP